MLDAIRPMGGLNVLPVRFNTSQTGLRWTRISGEHALPTHCRKIREGVSAAVREWKIGSEGKCCAHTRPARPR
jgi:hypothetical protein